MSRRNRKVGNQGKNIGYPCKVCGSENTQLDSMRNILQCKECGTQTEYKPEDITSKKRRMEDQRRSQEKKLENMSKVEKIKFLTHMEEEGTNRTKCGLSKDGKFKDITMSSSPSSVNCDRCITNM